MICDADFIRAAPRLQDFGLSRNQSLRYSKPVVAARVSSYIDAAFPDLDRGVCAKVPFGAGRGGHATRPGEYDGTRCR